jgi:hypothetical protein
MDSPWYEVWADDGLTPPDEEQGTQPFVWN